VDVATSVKMRDQDKRRLDRLQGELTLRRGEKLSQQELMSLLLDLAEEERGRLEADAERPMTENEIAFMERLCVRVRITIQEEEIDRIVAGQALE